MHLDGGAGPDRPLDADRRRLAEVDVEAELVRQRRLDDLLLHLAVERDGDLLPDVVLPHVDQRVLLGELGERHVERAPVGPAAGDDDRLEGRRGEVVLRPAPFGGMPIASPIRMSPRPQSLPICPAATDAAAPPAPRSNTLIAVTFRSSSVAEAQPVARPHRAREHPDVRDLLPGRTAFDLEDGARQPAFGVAVGRGQEFAMPAVNASTPAPVIAEPKNTGCTSVRAVCVASSSRSRR